MADNLATNLRVIEKYVVKLKKKLNRADIDYSVQASVSSTDPKVVRYAAQLTAPANGLAPITFIALTADELVDKIKLATEAIDYNEVEKAYHQAQIEACERTILGHKDRMAEIEKEQNGDDEEDDATEAVSDEIKELENEADNKS